MADERPVDESPLSEFVCKMKQLLAQRLEAKGARDKAAIGREMRNVMQQYLGRGAWQAMVDAERVEADVSRDTSRDRSCHARARKPRPSVRGPRRRYAGEFDYKRAQARDRNDD